ncbi:MAG: DUF1501 domain-containing protein [Gemmataceae bacterium]
MLRLFHPHRLSRREWLWLGALPGLAMPTLRAAPAPSGVSRARSVLVVFASGGQSQLETWDPKPDAPVEIRGQFGTIPTTVPGTRLGEHLPRLARLAHRYAIVRSMAHDDLDHGSACYLALTGRFHARKSSNPLPRPTDSPALGAIVRRLRRGDRLPYSAVQLNGPLLVPEIPSAGQYGGILGRGHEPLALGDVRDGASELAGLEPRDEIPPVRLDRRRTLLQHLEQFARALERDRAALDHDVRRRQAYELMASPSTRALFDLSREAHSVRERYGLHRAGQACLLARRLVEAGVPHITVFFNPSVRGQDKHPDQTDAYGWDTHNDIFEALRDHLLPRFDQTFSVLLEDLRERGLLESTLVLCQGEFGRAPLVAVERNFAGTTPGRKHWAGCYSLVAAGAGVVPGKVVGVSDRHAAYPVTPAFSPADLAATQFAALGIDPHGHFFDTLDRPIVISEGDPIRALYQG